MKTETKRKPSQFDKNSPGFAINCYQRYAAYHVLCCSALVYLCVLKFIVIVNNRQFPYNFPLKDIF